MSRSFEFHADLCPRLWEDDKLRPEVRKKLLRIAKAFSHYLQVGAEEIPLKDIIITGSLANYNYSEAHSDIDLHLVVDFKSIPDATKEYLGELYTAKKALWNTSHNLVLEGFPVELYGQDTEDELRAAGVYSILNDKWLSEPDPTKPEVDELAVEMKAQDLREQIDFVLEHGSVNSFEVLKKKIKSIRQAGLDRGGEFSVENLCYKKLRSEDYIAKLWDGEVEVEDKELLADSLRTR